VQEGGGQFVQLVWRRPREMTAMLRTSTTAMTATTRKITKKTMIYSEVAHKIHMKPASVKAAIEGILTLAAVECKKHGSFKLAGMWKLSIKNKKLRGFATKKFEKTCRA